MNNYAKGVDISSIQGNNFSWQAIVDAGYSFVIARNGVGSNQLDGLYSKNVAGAKSVSGIYFGCYNVIYPLSNDDPAKEATYHYKASEGIPSFIDLEWPTPENWSKYNISADSITKWTLEYLQAYEQLSGVKPIIYSYPSFFQALHLPQSFGSDYKLWIASYTTNPVIPKPWTDWVAWQNSGGSQNLPGTHTPVDTNYCKDLSIFGVQQAPPQVVVPPIPEVNTPPDPVVDVQDPIAANPPTTTVVTPGTNPTFVNTIETTLQNNPGILNSIQNIVVKAIQKLFHIK